MADDLKLPPGATLVTPPASPAVKLPPGATLVSSPAGTDTGPNVNPSASDDDIIKSFGFDPAVIKSSPRYQSAVKQHGSGVQFALTKPGTSLVADTPGVAGSVLGGVADVGQGANDVLSGIVQLARHGAGAIGAISNADVQYGDLLDRVQNQDFLHNVRHDNAHPALRFLGNVLVPVPGGPEIEAGASLPRVAGVGALQGAKVAAVQPVSTGAPDDYGTQKLIQTGIGAATGGTLGTVFDVAGKSLAKYGASKGVQLPSEIEAAAAAANAKAEQAAATANTAAEQTAQAANTSAEQTAAAARTTAESRATAQQLQAQQQATGTKTAAQTAAQKTADDLQANMERQQWADYGAVKSAAAGGDEAAQGVLAKLDNAGTDPGKIHEASIDLSDWRTAQESKRLYDVRDALTEEHQLGVVPLDQTGPAIRRSVAQAQFGVRNKPVLGVLKEVEDALTPQSAMIPGTPASTLTDASGQPLRGAVPPVQGQGWPTNSVAMMRKLSDDLGERIRMNSSGDNALIGPAGIGQLQAVKTAIDRDTARFIEQSGVPEVQQAAKAADDYYATQRVPFRDLRIANAGSGATDSDQIFNKFIQAGKGEQAQRFYDALDPKGRAAVQYSMVAKAMNDATDNLSGDFNHGKFFNSMDKLGDSYGVFFTGPDKLRMKGLQNLMQQAAQSDAQAEAVKAVTDANVKNVKAVTDANTKATAEAGKSDIRTTAETGKAQVSSTAEAFKQKVEDAKARLEAVTKHPLGIEAAATGAGTLALSHFGLPLGYAAGTSAGITTAARALLMTDAGKRFLMAAGATTPGSLAMQRLLNRMGTVLGQSGARAAAQQ